MLDDVGGGGRREESLASASFPLLRLSGSERGGRRPPPLSPRLQQLSSRTEKRKRPLPSSASASFQPFSTVWQSDSAFSSEPERAKGGTPPPLFA